MKRILIALLTSLVGIVLSWIFLRPSEWKREAVSSERVLARVLSVSNDVRRQLKGRQLWERLSSGDSLYLGDRLRTEINAHVTFEFTSRNSTVSVEENSLIVVEQDQEVLSLNMIEGRLFVQQDDSVPPLDIVTANKKLKIKGEAGVRASANGVEELSVIKGEVSSLDSLSNEVDVVTSKLSGLFPGYGDQVFVDDLAEVSWNSSVTYNGIELGPSINEIKSVDIVSSAPNRLKFLANYGTYFWRLVGDKGKTPLVRTTWIKRQLPVLISPSPKERLFHHKAGETLDLRWAGDSPDNTWIIQISRRPDFSQLAIEKEVKERTFTSIENLDIGTYFWRVIWKKDRNFISDVWSFDIAPRGELPSPSITSPGSNSLLVVSGINSDVELRWSPVEQAQQYFFVIKNKDGDRKEYQTSNSSFLLKNLPLGEYSISLVAKDNQGNSSIPAKSDFAITTLKPLKWKLLPHSLTYVDQPIFAEISWEGLANERFLILIESGNKNDPAEMISVNEPFYRLAIKEAKDISLRVQRLNVAGEVVAQSDTAKISVQTSPLPPTPELDQSEVKATGGGIALIKLKNYNPSFLAHAELVDQSNSLVDQKKSKEDSIELKDLRPGVYWLSLFYEDGYRRRSKNSVRIKVVVPDKSTIAPPKLKGIRVQ